MNLFNGSIGSSVTQIYIYEKSVDQVGNIYTIIAGRVHATSFEDFLALQNSPCIYCYREPIDYGLWYELEAC